MVLLVHSHTVQYPFRLTLGTFLSFPFQNSYGPLKCCWHGRIVCYCICSFLPQKKMVLCYKHDVFCRVPKIICWYFHPQSWSHRNSPAASLISFRWVYISWRWLPTFSQKGDQGCFPVTFALFTFHVKTASLFHQPVYVGDCSTTTRSSVSHMQQIRHKASQTAVLQLRPTSSPPSQAFPTFPLLALIPFPPPQAYNNTWEC